MLNDNQVQMLNETIMLQESFNPFAKVKDAFVQFKNDINNVSAANKLIKEMKNKALISQNGYEVGVLHPIINWCLKSFLQNFGVGLGVGAVGIVATKGKIKNAAKASFAGSTADATQNMAKAMKIFKIIGTIGNIFATINSMRIAKNELGTKRRKQMIDNITLVESKLAKTKNPEAKKYISELKKLRSAMIK